MKKVLLSADSAISVYAVPDEIADHLEDYCLEFCQNWLPKSPDAERYRVNIGGLVGFHYDERDFINYLNQYVCAAQATLLEMLDDTYNAENLPDAYAGLPYFNF